MLVLSPEEGVTRKKHVFALAKEGDSLRRLSSLSSLRRLSSLSSSSGNIAVRET